MANVVQGKNLKVFPAIMMSNVSSVLEYMRPSSTDWLLLQLSSLVVRQDLGLTAVWWSRLLNIHLLHLQTGGPSSRPRITFEIAVPLAVSETHACFTL